MKSASGTLGSGIAPMTPLKAGPPTGSTCTPQSAPGLQKSPRFSPRVGPHSSPGRSPMRCSPRAMRGGHDSSLSPRSKYLHRHYNSDELIDQLVHLEREKKQDTLAQREAARAEEKKKLKEKKCTLNAKRELEKEILAVMRDTRKEENRTKKIVSDLERLEQKKESLLPKKLTMEEKLEKQRQELERKHEQTETLASQQANRAGELRGRLKYLQYCKKKLEQGVILDTRQPRNTVAALDAIRNEEKAELNKKNEDLLNQMEAMQQRIKELEAGSTQSAAPAASRNSSAGRISEQMVVNSPRAMPAKTDYGRFAVPSTIDGLYLAESDGDKDVLQRNGSPDTNRSVSVFSKSSVISQAEEEVTLGGAGKKSVAKKRVSTSSRLTTNTTKTLVRSSSASLNVKSQSGGPGSRKTSPALGSSLAQKARSAGGQQLSRKTSPAAPGNRDSSATTRSAFQKNAVGRTTFQDDEFDHDKSQHQNFKRDFVLPELLGAQQEVKELLSCKNQHQNFVQDFLHPELGTAVDQMQYEKDCKNQHQNFKRSEVLPELLAAARYSEYERECKEMHKEFKRSEVLPELLERQAQMLWENENKKLNKLFFKQVTNELLDMAAQQQGGDNLNSDESANTRQTSRQSLSIDVMGGAGGRTSDPLQGRATFARFGAEFGGGKVSGTRANAAHTVALVLTPREKERLAAIQKEQADLEMQLEKQRRREQHAKDNQDRIRKSMQDVRRSVRESALRESVRESQRRESERREMAKRNTAKRSAAKSVPGMASARGTTENSRRGQSMFAGKGPSKSAASLSVRQSSSGSIRRSSSADPRDCSVQPPAEAERKGALSRPSHRGKNGGRTVCVMDATPSQVMEFDTRRTSQRTTARSSTASNLPGRETENWDGRYAVPSTVDGLYGKKSQFVPDPRATTAQTQYGRYAVPSTVGELYGEERKKSMKVAGRGTAAPTDYGRYAVPSTVGELYDADRKKSMRVTSARATAAPTDYGRYAVPSTVGDLYDQKKKSMRVTSARATAARTDYGRYRIPSTVDALYEEQRKSKCLTNARATAAPTEYGRYAVPSTVGDLYGTPKKTMRFSPSTYNEEVEGKKSVQLGGRGTTAKTDYGRYAVPPTFGELYTGDERKSMRVTNARGTTCKTDYGRYAVPSTVGELYTEDERKSMRVTKARGTTAKTDYGRYAVPSTVGELYGEDRKKSMKVTNSRGTTAKTDYGRYAVPSTVNGLYGRETQNCSTIEEEELSASNESNECSDRNNAARQTTTAFQPPARVTSKPSSRGGSAQQKKPTAQKHKTQRSCSEDNFSEEARILRQEAVLRAEQEEIDRAAAQGEQGDEVGESQTSSNIDNYLEQPVSGPGFEEVDYREQPRQKSSNGNDARKGGSQKKKNIAKPIQRPPWQPILGGKKPNAGNKQKRGGGGAVRPAENESEDSNDALRESADSSDDNARGSYLRSSSARPPQEHSTGKYRSQPHKSRSQSDPRKQTSQHARFQSMSERPSRSSEQRATETKLAQRKPTTFPAGKYILEDDDSELESDEEEFEDAEEIILEEETSSQEGYDPATCRRTAAPTDYGRYAVPSTVDGLYGKAKKTMRFSPSTYNEEVEGKKSMRLGGRGTAAQTEYGRYAVPSTVGELYTEDERKSMRVTKARGTTAKTDYGRYAVPSTVGELYKGERAKSMRIPGRGTTAQTDYGRFAVPSTVGELYGEEQRAKSMRIPGRGTTAQTDYGRFAVPSTVGELYEGERAKSMRIPGRGTTAQTDYGRLAVPSTVGELYGEEQRAKSMRIPGRGTTAQTDYGRFAVPSTVGELYPDQRMKSMRVANARATAAPTDYGRYAVPSTVGLLYDDEQSDLDEEERLVDGVLQEAAETGSDAEEEECSEEEARVPPARTTEQTRKSFIRKKKEQLPEWDRNDIENMKGKRHVGPSVPKRAGTTCGAALKPNQLRALRKSRLAAAVNQPLSGGGEQGSPELGPSRRASQRSLDLEGTQITILDEEQQRLSQQMSEKKGNQKTRTQGPKSVQPTAMVNSQYKDFDKCRPYSCYPGMTNTNNGIPPSNGTVGAAETSPEVPVTDFPTGQSTTYPNSCLPKSSAAQQRSSAKKSTAEVENLRAPGTSATALYQPRDSRTSDFRQTEQQAPFSPRTVRTSGGVAKVVGTRVLTGDERKRVLSQTRGTSQFIQPLEQPNGQLTPPPSPQKTTSGSSVIGLQQPSLSLLQPKLPSAKLSEKPKPSISKASITGQITPVNAAPTSPALGSATPPSVHFPFDFSAPAVAKAQTWVAADRRSSLKKSQLQVPPAECDEDESEDVRDEDRSRSDEERISTSGGDSDEDSRCPVAKSEEQLGNMNEEMRYSCRNSASAASQIGLRSSSLQQRTSNALTAGFGEPSYSLFGGIGNQHYQPQIQRSSSATPPRSSSPQGLSKPLGLNILAAVQSPQKPTSRATTAAINDIGRPTRGSRMIPVTGPVLGSKSMAAMPLRNDQKSRRSSRRSKARAIDQDESEEEGADDTPSHERETDSLGRSEAPASSKRHLKGKARWVAAVKNTLMAKALKEYRQNHRKSLRGSLAPEQCRKTLRPTTFEGFPVRDCSEEVGAFGGA